MFDALADVVEQQVLYLHSDNRGQLPWANVYSLVPAHPRTTAIAGAPRLDLRHFRYGLSGLHAVER